MSNPGIGDNSLPFAFDAALIEARLLADNEDLVKRISGIDTAATFKLPLIDSEEEAGRRNDFAVQIRKAQDEVKGRKAEQVAPYEKPAEIAKGFFTRLADQLAGARETVDKTIADWGLLKRKRARASAWRPVAGECLDRYRNSKPVAEQELENLRILGFLNEHNVLTQAGRLERNAYEEAQERARAEAAGRTADRERQLAEGGIEEEIADCYGPLPTPAQPPPPVAIPIPTSATTVRSARGSSSSVTVSWKAVIVNAELVPREYCEPAQAKINAAMKLLPKDQDGKPTRDIPGVQWQESAPKVTVRGG